MVGITLSSACSNTPTGFCLVLFSIRSSAPYTIDSATDFLPACMIEFMNLEITRFPNFGSGLISRFSALCRRDIGVLSSRHGQGCPDHLRLDPLETPGSHSASPRCPGVLRKEADYFGL